MNTAVAGYLDIPRMGRRVSLDRPLVMGILNLNDDSFCDDGTLDPQVAQQRVHALLADGADIIDIGAESARTNRGAIPVDEELARLQPLLRSFDDIVAAARPRDDLQIWPPLLSINTWRGAVADPALASAGDILNDMSGLPDDGNARVCARHGAALLIMHTVGEPKVPQTHRRWDDILHSMEAFFTTKIALAVAAGVPRDALLLDPGIDFAKTGADNLRIYREARRLAIHGLPVLLPVSRKTVIGDVLGIARPADRDPATIACLVAGILRLPAAIFRVHNVAAAAHAVRIIHALR